MEANRKKIFAHLNPAADGDLGAVALLPVDVYLKDSYLEAFSYVQ